MQLLGVAFLFCSHLRKSEFTKVNFINEVYKMVPKIFYKTESLFRLL